MNEKQLARLIKLAPPGYRIPDARLLPLMIRYGKTN